MNPSARAYSCFPALLIFFAAVTVMDVDQMMTVHQKKVAAMGEYRQALVLRQQVDAQEKWVGGLRQDLLRLAPGDAEAAAIVGELGSSRSRGINSLISRVVIAWTRSFRRAHSGRALRDVIR